MSVNKTYHLQRTVAELEVYNDIRTSPYNVTTNWVFDFGTIGSDACYMVDFVDVDAGKRWL